MPITSAKMNTPVSLHSELIAIRPESLIDIAGIAMQRPKGGLSQHHLHPGNPHNKRHIQHHTIESLE